MIELMAAAVVLAVGTLLLQGGLLRSAHLYGRYSDTLKVNLWADEKLWQAREDILYTDPPDTGSGNGSFTIDGKDYAWSLDTRALQGQGIYSVNLNIQWDEGGTPYQLKREMYATLPKKTQ
jgi:hypothetical protein